MNRKLLSVILALVAVFVVFLLIAGIGPLLNPNLKLDNTAVLRFVFVGIGLVIVFGVYFFTREHKMWEVGTREVVFMAIGAALYAVLSFLFNGTVFVVPSVSQVALRPAICIPMFFGYAFGPVVGFFTGAVGNMFGDALTGFGLSPQWSVGNGLIGMIAGLVFLFEDKKKSMNVVLIVSGVLAALATIIFLANSTFESAPSQAYLELGSFRVYIGGFLPMAVKSSLPNMMYFNADANIFGDQPITLFAGISALVGFVLVLAVRFIFGKNVDLAAAVTWSMLGNFLGIGFAAISDIWVNGYTLPAAIVGEFLPSAGPNMLFAAILVPLLVAAYSAVRRQSGR